MILRLRLVTACGLILASPFGCGGQQRLRSNSCRVQQDEILIVDASPDKWPRIGDACVVNGKVGVVVK
jgi:hypothetical protein